jgi:hypothetical protein
LGGNLFSILIGSRRTRRPLIGARDFEAFIGQGEQTQGRSWRLTKGEDFFFVCGEEKKRRMKCEEGFSSYVWRGVHGKGVCKNQAWKEVVCSKYL